MPADTARVPLRAFASNQIQNNTLDRNTLRQNIKKPQRPLSCFVQCENIVKCAGFNNSTSVDRAVSYSNVTQSEDGFSYQGQIFGLNTDQSGATQRRSQRHRSSSAHSKSHRVTSQRSVTVKRDYEIVTNTSVTVIEKTSVSQHSQHNQSRFSDYFSSPSELDISVSSCPSGPTHRSQTVSNPRPARPMSKTSFDILPAKPWSPPKANTTRNSTRRSRQRELAESHNPNHTLPRNAKLAKTPKSDKTKSVPLMKPWSPPPAELYSKDIDSVSNTSSNTFAKRRSSRKSRSHKELRNISSTESNFSQKWDATSVDSGHCSELSFSDCTELDFDRSTMPRRMLDRSHHVTHKDRVNIVRRERTPSPSDIASRPRLATPEHAKPRSQSVNSLLHSQQKPMYEGYEIDLDKTLTPSKSVDLVTETPGKMNNTYASLVGVKDTPPTVKPPMLPPRDLERSPRSHLKIVVPTLKRSPKVKPSTYRPLMKLRKQNCDSIKRSFRNAKEKLTSKSVILSTKFHKYSIEDIVNSYCNLVKDITPENLVLQQLTPQMQDISIDSGHETLSQCSPKSNLEQTFSSSCSSMDRRPRAVVKPRTVSLDQSGMHRNGNELHFKDSLHIGEFYC